MSLHSQITAKLFVMEMGANSVRYLLVVQKYSIRSPLFYYTMC